MQSSILDTPKNNNQHDENGKPCLIIVNNVADVSSAALFDENTPEASAKNLTYHRNILLKNKDIMNVIYSSGITELTTQYFQIGLTKDCNSIRIPIIDRNGAFTKRSSLIFIQEFNIDDIKNNSRQAGLPVWLYNQAYSNQSNLIVVDNIIDYMLIHQALDTASILSDYIVICSSHCHTIPKSGTNPIFYNQYNNIYITNSFGKTNDLIKVIASCSNGKARLLDIPDNELNSWSEYINNGFNKKNFIKNLKNSDLIKVSASSTPKNKNIQDYEPFKDYSLDALDISGIAFSNGFLYYPILTHYVGQDVNNGKIVIGHSRRIVIARSPKRSQGIGPELYEFSKLDQVVRDDTINDPLYVLSDGTLLDQKPRVSRRASWDFDSIKDYIEGKITCRNIDDILIDIIEYYKSQFFLPINDDYILLALATIATHCQQVFKAVPLLLATGPAGSGKSTMGYTMSTLCANPEVFGQISPATLTRAMDENRGFAVLDDLEKVANSGEGFGELEQALKVSYNKNTAIRPVTIMKGGDGIVRKMNFFGIKLFNNTKGIESIIGTRTLTIHTQKAIKGKFKIYEKFTSKQISNLQNELHIWSFENIEDVSISYKEFPTEQRIDEITAPLKSIASLSKNNQEILSAIDRIIDRHNDELQNNDTPEDILKEALFNIYEQGFESLCLEHVLLEMRTLVPQNWGKDYTTEIPEWQQNTWIKRKLRSYGWILPSGTRKRVTRLRSGSAPMIYKLEDRLSIEYKEEHGERNSETEEIQGENFCRRYSSCKDCKYQSLDCELKKQK
ncbi:MAG: hypothetical protein OEY89_12730 [Gammaproteobacteria bacterium]|nr:hypothetical protein [Gammaproteobacteria bacterium]